jgi:GNAT superfamily N-acetyltransferase
MTTLRQWDIRVARRADVPRLRELGALGWETTYQEIVRPENRAAYLAGDFWSETTLSRVVSDPACLALVASSEVSLDGFLTAEPAGGATIELTRFYVDSIRRRTGIGAALFEHALAWARGRGARTMTVNVFADNTIGCAFYERAGFRRTRLCPTIVGDQTVRDAWYALELS